MLLPATRRHSIAAVYLTALAVGAAGVTFPASSTLLRARLGLGDTLYGACFLPGLGLAILTALAGPRLLRRWCLKRLFHFGLATQVAAMALLALSSALPRPSGLIVLFAAMAIGGPGGGVLGIALNTAAIEIFPRTRGTALAALHALLAGGAALWPMVVAMTARLRSWAIAPLALAAILLGIAWLAGRRSVVGLADGLNHEHGRFHIDPRLCLRALTGFVYGIGEATFTSWVVIYLLENHHLPLAVAAGALSGFWLAMGIGRASAAWVVHRRALLPVALALAGGMAISFLLVAHCGPASAVWRFALAGLCCSALFPLLLALGSLELPDRTPHVSALFSAAGMAGLAVGSFGVGPLRARLGLPAIYTLSSVGPVLLILLLLGLHRFRVSPAWHSAGGPQPRV
jgi:predicted MFS family arabinose efflux permease